MELVDIELVSYYLSSEIYKLTDEWKSECNLIADSDLFKDDVPLSSLYKTTIAPETLAKLKIITLFRSMMQRLFPMINKSMVEKLQSIWIANAIGILINCVNNVQHRLNPGPGVEWHPDGSVSMTFNTIVVLSPSDESKSSDKKDLKKRERAARTVAYKEALEKFNNFKKNLTSQITEFWLMYVCHTISKTDPMQSVNNDQWTTIMGTLNESKNKNECMKKALKFMFKIITEMFDTHLTESESKLTPILKKAKEKIGMTDVGMVTIDTLEKRRNELKLDKVANFVEAYTSLLGDIVIGTTDDDVLKVAQHLERHFNELDMLLKITNFVDSMPLEAIMYACLAYTDTATSTVVADSKAPPQTSININVLQHDITQFLNNTIETDFYIGECIFSIIWADVLSIYGNLKNALQTKGLLFCDLRITKDTPKKIRTELTRLNMFEDATNYVNEITGATKVMDGGGNNNSKKIVRKINKYTKKWKGRGGMFGGLAEQVTQVLINLPQLLAYTSNIPTEYIKYVSGGICVCLTTLIAKKKLSISTMFNVIRNILAIAAVCYGIYYTCCSQTSALRTFSDGSLKSAGDYASQIVTGTHYTTNIITTQMNTLGSISWQDQTAFVTMVKESNDKLQGDGVATPTIDTYASGTPAQQLIATAAKNVHTRAIAGFLGKLNDRAEMAAKVASPPGNLITPSSVHNDMARNAIGIEFLKKPITEIAKDTKLNQMTDAFTKLQDDSTALRPKLLAEVGSRNIFNLDFAKHDATTLKPEFTALREHRQQGGEIINILLLAFRLHKVSDMAGSTFKDVAQYINTFRRIANNQISTVTVTRLDSFSDIASVIINKYGGFDETYKIPFTNDNDIIQASEAIGPIIKQLNEANGFYTSDGVSDDILRLVTDKIDDIDGGIGDSMSVREPLFKVFKDPSTIAEYFKTAKQGGIGIERAYKNLMYPLVSTASRFFDKGLTQNYNMPISTNLLSRSPAQQDAAACAIGVGKHGESSVVALYLNAVMSNTVISSSAKTIITNMISMSVSKVMSQSVVGVAGGVQAAAAAAAEPTTAATTVAAAQAVKTIAPLINDIYSALLTVDSAENAVSIVSELTSLVKDARTFLDFNQNEVGQLCSISKAVHVIDEFISDKMTHEEFQLRMSNDNEPLLAQFNEVIDSIGRIIPQEQKRLQQQQQQQQPQQDVKDIAYKAGWAIFLFCAVSALPKLYTVISSKYQSITTLKGAFSIPGFTFAGLFSKTKTNKKEENTTNRNIEFYGGGNKNKIKTRKIKTNYYSKKTYKRRYNNNKRCIKRRHTKKRNTRK